MGERIAVELRVHGRVQGVWYRDSTRREAQELGLHGWVRNEPDGGVRIFVEGEEDSVEKLILWCQDGPPLAQVDHIERRSVTPIGGDDTCDDEAFKVTY